MDCWRCCWALSFVFVPVRHHLLEGLSALSGRRTSRSRSSTTRPSSIRMARADPEALAAANYSSAGARVAARAVPGGDRARARLRALYRPGEQFRRPSSCSAGSRRDPALIGQAREAGVPGGADVDQLLKGHIDRDAARVNRALTERPADRLDRRSCEQTGRPGPGVQHRLPHQWRFARARAGRRLGRGGRFDLHACW